MASVPTPPRPKSWIGRLLRGAFSLLLALIVFIEEWVWDVIARAMARLSKSPPIRWVEARIARAPRYVALLMFLIPGLALLPFKLAGVWLIAHGQKLLGVGVFCIAKVVGTALLARIFTLTRPQLMSIGWFAWCHERFSLWKARLFAYVRAMPSYQWARGVIAGWRTRARTWWSQHFHHQPTKAEPNE